ncbi:hypothetical protein GV794_23535 [Nocardia cyriacigeorgica]|uniref:Uncharacterized protein n=1 Tax=Nocardia cyriacigeorgica TaxID=135487 RepID=A0ABX0CTB1_9NOCA|nr:hypothetical protein [Nocardia cyriacigeorgica]NEW58593.1 hypothetical protein [Nocardia cyriacigeorgica]
MSDEKDQIKHWQGLKQQAIDGTLRMEEGIGEELRSACEQYLTKLRDLRDEAKSLNHLAGYGGLPSALHLRDKFQAKAVAGRADDSSDSAVARLTEHITIAELMRDTYSAAIGQLQQTDQNTGQQLGQTGQ